MQWEGGWDAARREVWGTVMKNGALQTHPGMLRFPVVGAANDPGKEVIMLQTPFVPKICNCFPARQWQD